MKRKVLALAGIAVFLVACSSGEFEIKESGNKRWRQRKGDSHYS
jgi:uncharacterized BrkB/YihY/UPF0761 family membrane protein